MKIVDVCVGRPSQQIFQGQKYTTSIFKDKVVGPVSVIDDNLEGDRQHDLNFHGGRDKAIYVYSQDYYAHWKKELGVHRLEVSQFGENLTVSGCRDEDIVIGTQLCIGSVQASVRQGRIPCAKLGLRLGDADFPQRFWEKGLLGFYLRVDKAGSLQAGDEISIVDIPAHGITLRRVWAAVVNCSSNDATEILNKLDSLDAGWLRRLRKIAKQ